MKRYHVHGEVNVPGTVDAKITVTVEASDDEEAQDLAWLACPQMDVEEIEETEPK